MESDMSFDAYKTIALAKYERDVLWLRERGYRLDIKFKVIRKTETFSETFFNETKRNDWKNSFPLLYYLINFFKFVLCKTNDLNINSKEKKVDRIETLLILIEIYPLNLNKSMAIKNLQWISFCGYLAESKKSSNSSTKYKQKNDIIFEIWLKRKKRLIDKMNKEDFFEKHKNDFLMRTFFYNRYSLLLNKKSRKKFPTTLIVLGMVVLIVMIFFNFMSSAELYEKYGILI